MTSATPTPQDKQAVRDAGTAYAQKEIARVFENSSIEDRSAAFPKFARDELGLGKLLGKGGFGAVYEVNKFNAASATGRTASSRSLMDAGDAQVEEGEMESRAFIAEHCLRNNSDCRYAVKLLKQDVIDDPPLFIQAVMDMAIETRMLSWISHPNICRLRGTAKVSPYSESYFIILDRLYDTMEKRIEKWASATARCSGCLGKLFDSGGRKLNGIYEEKIVAAFDLSAALDYLHKHGILYRDLKPENIGFDIRNDVKIFDFGLAKELMAGDKTKDGLYNLTGMTGSPRYMAPEVGLEQAYNEKCDVYSFAILMWEMLAMKTPFELYTIRKMKATVWDAPNKRPFMDDSWPLAVSLMIRRAWSHNISERPTFSQVTQILRKECVRCRDGDDTGLEHSRRRSTFVLTSARSRRLDRSSSNTSGRKPAPMLSAEDLEGLDLDLSVSRKMPT